LNLIEHPIVDSYLAAPQFYAGIYPAKSWDQYEKNIADLLDAGVRCFINLTYPGEYDGVDYEPLVRRAAAQRNIQADVVRMPIDDLSIPTPEWMKAILDRIDRARAEGKTVYAHCYGGRGRTGTVVGCYLVRHGLSGREALARIEELRYGIPSGRWPSPETWEQRNFVENWREEDV
jgi:hypothetical protein